MGVKLEDLLKENNKGPLLEDKSKKTIKLLLTVIAIIVVLIVIFVVIMISNSTQKAQIERAKQLSTDIDLISAYIQNIYSEYRQTGDSALLVGISQEESNITPIALNVNGHIEEYKYGYYYVTAAEIKAMISTLNIENEDYVLNYSTGDVVNLRGARWNGKIYYSVEDLRAIRDGQTPPSDYTIYINKPEEMQYLHQYPNGYFKLTNDIDMSMYATGDGWQPVAEFSGVFEGRGYVIKNLIISRTSSRYCGLFGQIKNGATINDLKLENVNISGGEFTGAIAGACSGTVNNCTISGNVNGTFSCAGGVFGLFENGLASNIISNVSVNGNENVGGFAGAITSGTVYRCSFEGAVNGNKNVGGFVGRVNPASDTIINQVYANSNISATEFAGGMIGAVEMQNASNLEVADSYSKGQISFCDNTVGGFVGSIRANTNTNFKFYHVYTTVDTPKECQNSRGGFAGEITTGKGGESTLCYWEKENIYDYDLENVGKTNNAVLDFEPHTPAEMRSATIFADWDLEEVWKTVTNDTPVLRWQ